MKNWKLAVLVVGGLWLMARNVQADGSFQPVLSPNTTGGQYNYPTAPSPVPGGVLTNDGVGTFRWDTSVITTTTPAVISQLMTISSMTAAQIAVSSPVAYGQMVVCTNCTKSNAGLGMLCISSGTSTGQWLGISSQTTNTGCL